MSILQGSEAQGYFRHRLLPVPADNVQVILCSYTPYAVLVAVNNQLLDRSQVNVSSGTQFVFTRKLSVTDRVVVYDLPNIRVTPGLAKVVQAYNSINKVDFISVSQTLEIEKAYGTLVCNNVVDINITLPLSSLMEDGAHLTFIMDNPNQVTLTAQANDLRGLGVKNNSFLLFEQGTHVELMASPTGWVVVDTNQYGLLNYRAVVGAIEHYPSRLLAAPGTVFADGQVLSRTTFPSLFRLVQEGKVPVVSEVDWLSTPSKRTSYTMGNGSTTFRVPDYNGKFDATSIAPFMRGDGGKSLGVNGGIQGDAIRDLVGGVAGIGFNNRETVFDTTGVMANGTPVATIASNTNSVAQAGFTGFKFSAAKGLPPDTTTDPITGENRPANFSVVFAIRAFGAVVNIGEADAGQLATDYANLASRVGQLEVIPKPIGYQQVWTNMLASRSLGTTFTNNTDRTRSVSITANSSAVAGTMGASLQAFVDGREISRGTFCYGPTAPTSIYFTVGPHKTYRVVIGSGAGALLLWEEEL